MNSGDLRSGNLISVHQSEGEALADIHAAMIAHGSAYVDGLTLVRLDLKADALVSIGEGPELAERARAVQPAPVQGKVEATDHRKVTTRAKRSAST